MSGAERALSYQSWLHFLAPPWTSWSLHRYPAFSAESNAWKVTIVLGAVQMRTMDPTALRMCVQWRGEMLRESPSPAALLS